MMEEDELEKELVRHKTGTTTAPITLQQLSRRRITSAIVNEDEFVSEEDERLLRSLEHQPSIRSRLDKSSGYSIRRNYRENVMNDLTPPSSRRSIFTLSKNSNVKESDELFVKKTNKIEVIKETNDTVLSGVKFKKLGNGLKRLSKISRTKSNSIDDTGSKVSRTKSNSMDDTGHIHLKGKGFLASKKDIQLDLEVFAEGCKFLALVARGDVDTVKVWMNDSNDFVKFRDYDRRTALHVAASEGHLHIVKYIVMFLELSYSKFTKERIINRSDRWGGSPLDDAHRHQHKEVALYLRQYGATTGSIDDHVSEFLLAASKGEVEIMRELIEMHVDYNAGDYDNRTAMHLAASGKHINAIRVLLENGANVNAIDRWGSSPLDDAKLVNATDVIQLLTENGAKSIANHGEPRKPSVDLSEHMGHQLESDNMRIEFSELDIIDRIGGGSFGEILKCRWRGSLVAAKCIRSAKIHREFVSKRKTSNVDNFDDISPEELHQSIEDFRSEIDIMKQIRHPNICMLLAYSTTSDYEVMVSELAKCSLEDVIKTNQMNNKQLSKRTQVVYVQQLAQGMNYLHTCKPPIIHRDLKPANLLIDYSGVLQITDFGLAKLRPKPSQKGSDTYRLTGETGSYRYMAPEVYRYEDYDEKVDVYSYAMIFYYIIAGHQPWPTLPGVKAAHAAAIEGLRPNIPRDWDQTLATMLKRCWDENPTLRPRFSNILQELSNYSHVVFKTEEDEELHELDLHGSKCGCIVS